MKKIAFLVLAVLALAACRSLKYVTGQEFQREYSLRNSQTLYYAEYIGQADGKVYMLKESLSSFGSEPKDQVLYTNADELNPQFINELTQPEKENSN